MSPRAHRPRLLLITPDFPPSRGGIQVLAQRLAAGLKGFETKVVALDSPGAREFDATSGLATRRVRSFRRLGAGRNVPLNAVALLAALRFRPHVTLSAHIVTSPAAAAIRRELGGRTVQYFHANEIGGKPKLSAFAARRADVAIAVSAYTADLVKGTGVSPADMRLIPPGVDLPSDPTAQMSERPMFVTVARLEDRYKGHDVLIRALALVRAEVPDVEWIVIGDGPLRPGLERLARSHGVANSVRFLGSVCDAQRDSWLRRADLLAMPSRLPGGSLAGEGFGIVYLEAGAHGKPVVAGNVAGAVDAVLDGKTGLLVDPTDHHAVACAITRLLLDRELARRLGSAGAERARRFAWPTICERLEAVLLEQVDGLPRSDARQERQPTGSTRTVV
ncbi:MAG TPA: glycosyltransferase family 4 protein [Solirubrobacteraceae bacterium]|nr:glycosyltransferase family 4 protein [Solirubrobacteraceae bacterium]